MYSPLAPIAALGSLAEHLLARYPWAFGAAVLVAMFAITAWESRPRRIGR